MSSAPAALLSLLGVPRPAAAAYLARGPWLLASWASAAALFALTLAATRAVWPSVVAVLPGTWLGDLYLTTTAVNGGLQLVLNLLLLPVYITGIADGWKAERSRPWPWASSREAAAKFWATTRRGAVLVTANILVVSYVALVGVAPVVRALHAETSFAVADLPSAYTTAAHIFFCLVVEDAMFYCSHRLLHTPYFYKRIHKMHHEYESVVGIASEHAHPIEFVVGNLGPVIVGPLLCNAHASTLLIFLALRIAVSVEEHSGLSLPFSPFRVTPWAALSAGHAWHHSHVVGVFASQFCYLDALFGTDKAFLESLELEDAKAKAACREKTA